MMGSLATAGLPAGLLIVSYLLGSVCSAIIVCKALGLADPRAEGSHNPGTTNVLRIGGKGPALLTLAGDMGKGVLPILLGRWLQLDESLIAAAAFMAFLGHLFPVFFRFEGGKGVATALGVLLVLYWPLGLAVLGLWLTGFALTRISSVGALAAFISAPLLWWQFDSTHLVGVTAISVLLLARHHSNIRALLRGEERKFGAKPTPTEHNTTGP